MFKKSFSLLIIVGLLCSCVYSPTFNPSVSYTVTPKDINSLPSPFRDLSFDENRTDWGKEYKIGKSFAKKMDLYRAITCFERALCLLPLEKHDRRLEIQYTIFKCYFLGEQYEKAIKLFETTTLAKSNNTFPAFRDLIIMLHDCYKKIGDDEKANTIMDLLNDKAPKTAEALQLSNALISGNLDHIGKYSSEYEHIPKIIKKYHRETKSVRKAQMLNIIPGLGYLYVEQNKSAATSFLLNSLFIAAAYHFFDNGNTAAGFITTGFEIGWYFGGITGAGLAANQYNEHLYNKYANKTVREKKLFPILMLKYGF